MEYWEYNRFPPNWKWYIDGREAHDIDREKKKNIESICEMRSKYISNFSIKYMPYECFLCRWTNMKEKQEIWRGSYAWEGWGMTRVITNYKERLEGRQIDRLLEKKRRWKIGKENECMKWIHVHIWWSMCCIVNINWMISLFVFDILNDGKTLTDEKLLRT